MNEFSGIMADILANPLDVMPRLVMADWLEERGYGWAPAFRLARLPLALTWRGGPVLRGLADWGRSPAAEMVSRWLFGSRALVGGDGEEEFGKCDITLNRFIEVDIWHGLISRVRGTARAILADGSRLSIQPLIEVHNAEYVPAVSARGEAGWLGAAGARTIATRADGMIPSWLFRRLKNPSRKTAPTPSLWPTAKWYATHLDAMAAIGRAASEWLLNDFRAHLRGDPIEEIARNAWRPEDFAFDWPEAGPEATCG